MSPTNESPYWSGLQASLVVQVNIQNLELTHHHDLLVDKASFINFTIPLHTMTAAIVPVVSVLGRYSTKDTIQEKNSPPPTLSISAPRARSAHPLKAAVPVSPIATCLGL